MIITTPRHCQIKFQWKGLCKKLDQKHPMMRWLRCLCFLRRTRWELMKMKKEMMRMNVRIALAHCPVTSSSMYWLSIIPNYPENLTISNFRRINSKESFARSSNQEFPIKIKFLAFTKFSPVCDKIMMKISEMAEISLVSWNLNWTKMIPKYCLLKWRCNTFRNSSNH